MKHEIFFDMLPSFVQTLEAISHEQLFQNQYNSTPWNWDGESRNKASFGACAWEFPDWLSKADSVMWLLNAVLRFPFLITQVTAMKYLSSVKPLSIRLQKHDIGVYEVYHQVDDIKGDLKLT